MPQMKLSLHALMEPCTSPQQAPQLKPNDDLCDYLFNVSLFCYSKLQESRALVFFHQLSLASSMVPGTLRHLVNTSQINMGNDGSKQVTCFEASFHLGVSLRWLGRKQVTAEARKTPLSLPRSPHPLTHLRDLCLSQEGLGGAPSS